MTIRAGTIGVVFICAPARAQRATRARRAGDRATPSRPRYASTAGDMLAIASCSRRAASALVTASASGTLSTWIVKIACAAAGDRNEGLALAAERSARGEGVGVDRARGRPVRAAARRMLVQARVGADRPDEALPALVAGDEPRQRCARRDEQLVVGDRRVDLGEVAADLLLGRPARRQADREPRDRRARAVDDGEVLFEGEASSALGRRAAGRAARTAPIDASPSPVGVPSASRAQPSRGASIRVAPAGVVVTRKVPGLERAASSATARSTARSSKAGVDSSAWSAKLPSTAIFSRRWRPPGRARRQLRRARRDAAQSRLHAERRADEREVERGHGRRRI